MKGVINVMSVTIVLTWGEKQINGVSTLFSFVMIKIKNIKRRGESLLHQSYFEQGNLSARSRVSRERDSLSYQSCVEHGGLPTRSKGNIKERQKHDQKKTKNRGGAKKQKRQREVASITSKGGRGDLRNIKDVRG